MRKNVFGRQFGRDTNQRKSLFKSLISSLILDESIKTTLEKAKSIKGDIDKIVNKAKKGDNRLKVQLLQRSLGENAMNKVIKDIAPRFADRNSGYTRIIKLGRRFSDNAAMALIEWVIKPEAKSEKLRVKSDIKELPAGKIEKMPIEKKSVKEVKKETKRKVVKK
ncbi:MAG: 50S ribosomal protein L17 [Candidatus Levybacteria bacterium]|nr:50S ribosomal protein L17 [Candidatus Levybacteria bacterium]